MGRRKKKYLFFIAGLITCFFSFTCCVAQPVVKTLVDRTTILVGQQFKVTVDANFSLNEYRLHWLSIPDSMQHFEVIDRGEIDTAYNGSKITDVTQTITLTSFDSGQWELPSFLVSFDSVKNDTMLNLFTDSITINVSFSPPDSTNQLRDIKPIREVNIHRPLWQWIAGGVLLLVLIIAAVWLYRYYKKPKTETAVVSKLSPYEEAMDGLDGLKKYAFPTTEELKSFHSKLSEIVKTYLTRKQNIDYREKTTSDVLVQLNNKLDKQQLSETASALRCGDAVKFAKYIAPENENKDCWVTIKKIIELLEKNEFQKPV